MKNELLGIMEDFNLDECIFLQSLIEKEDWDEVYAAASHVGDICFSICREIEESEDHE